MLSISKGDKKATTSGYYFKYYNRNKIGDAAWFGNGAEILGLQGAVTQAQFDALAKGFSPDGNELVHNAGSKERQGFWDLTFSVPKAVSVLWAAAPDEIKKEIEQCIERALHKTLLETEAECGISRHGKAGKNFSPAALTFATYFHVTSRENDPQLHWHCVLFNAGIRPDGSTGAIYTKKLYQEGIRLGLFFQNALAHDLNSTLNLEIEQREIGFHIKGVPETLCSVMSKRSHQINEELQRTGNEGAEAARVAAVLTRKNKKKISMEKLFNTWQEEAAAYDFGPNKVITLAQAKKEIKSEKIIQIENRSQANANSQETGNERKENEKAKSREYAKGRNKKQKREVKIAASRRWSSAEKAYFKELREATDRIFPERQQRLRITRMAYAMAKKHSINPRFVRTAIENLHLPVFGKFYRIEWKKVFWKAPAISPLSKIRTPRIVLRNTPRKWGKVRSRQGLWGIGPAKKEIRIQQRKLFPKAPEWNPASKIAIPAIRLAKKPKKQKELKPVQKPIIEREL